MFRLVKFVVSSIWSQMLDLFLNYKTLYVRIVIACSWDAIRLKFDIVEVVELDWFLLQFESYKFFGVGVFSDIVFANPRFFIF